jgi:hypothetical protein
MLKQVQHDNYVMEAGTRRPMGLDFRLRGNDMGVSVCPDTSGLYFRGNDRETACGAL